MTTTAATAGARLPFTAIDELGCYFDWPDEPNTVHVELGTSGRLDVDRLRSAVGAGLLTHPMACARRVPGSRYRRTFVWEIPERLEAVPLTVGSCPDDDALRRTRDALVSTALDVDTAPMRFHLARHPDGDVLLAAAHHAALDGLSCLRVVRSVTRRYSGVEDPVPPGALRREPEPVPAGPVATPPHRPARIAHDTAAPGPGYGVAHASVPFGRDAGAALRAKTGCTLNDILLAALFRTVERWNGEHGQDCATIRLTMPVNGRPGPWREEYAGNLSRLPSVATERADRRDPLALLTTIAEQTRLAKRTEVGSRVGLLARTLGSPVLPTALKAALARPVLRVATPYVDTALLSNLGRVDDVPEFSGAPTTMLRFSPPAWMPRGISLGALTFLDRLHVCFRYRLALFDDAAAARFAALYTTELRSLADVTADRSA